MRRLAALALLACARAALAQEVDDPMLRWDCDPAGQALALEMVVPPLAQVTERELYLFNGSAAFEQCRLGSATWTLLVDVVEYESGRCAQFPDTTVSLLRNGHLVLSQVLVGHNCGNRPVLSAARVRDPREGEARLELCTAWKYGEAGRCSAFAPRGLAALDNDAVAAHARGP